MWCGPQIFGGRIGFSSRPVDNKWRLEGLTASSQLRHFFSVRKYFGRIEFSRGVRGGEWLSQGFQGCNDRPC
eukprot:2001199-Pyramimonas_sp.AAC.1